MAEVDSTAPTEAGVTTDPINNLFYESAHYWGRMNAFFELVERDIKEQNNADLDPIAFLIIGAKAEFDRFTKLISKTAQAVEERSNQNVSPAEEGRAGAMACMDALRTTERMTDNMGGISLDAGWALQDKCVATMCDAAGKPDAFMTGFISAFAEFVFTLNSGGYPNFDRWNSESTMTEEEKATHRAAFTKRVEEGEKVAA